MIVLGLTGSIATGKSTVAKMFENLEVQIFNDDKVANKIISSKRMVKYFKESFKDTIINNKLSKNKLKDIVLKDINRLKQLENIVHPLVNLKRNRFILRHKLVSPKAVIMFDCPLLFEAGVNKQCDYVIVTHCSLDTQRKRAFARGNITENEFNFIIQRQMSNLEKVEKADFSINTESSIEQTTAEVKKILEKITYKK